MLRMILRRIPTILLSLSSGISNPQHPTSTYDQNACMTATGTLSDNQLVEDANPTQNTLT